MKRIGLLLMLSMLLLITEGAYAYNDSVLLPVENGYIELFTTQVEDETYLFLPAFANRSQLVFKDYEGEWRLEETAEEGVWLLKGLPGGSLKVMQSQNLRTLFVISHNPAEAGREYIESDPDHKLKAKADIVIVSAEGQLDYAGTLSYIRGRGNSTWTWEKKPYQIKLEDKIDLMKTGDPAEKNRIWLLLADARDRSLLHNRIALDLGLELGMTENPCSEHVDLFYDGEYRGTYLLTEKVEIGEGRVEERDYDALLKEWNRRSGINYLDELPLVQSSNRYGDPIAYVDGVEDNATDKAGAYLVEQSGRGGLRGEEASFVIGGDRFFAIKNPEHASRNMVIHVSERLSEGLTSLQNGGDHPESGETVENYFDLDSFARMMLVNELTYNLDAFVLSSTYFVLPEGEERFRAGPIWDFDSSMRHRRHLLNAGYGLGLKDTDCWMVDFYRIPSMLEHMRKIYEEELYGIIKEILLGKQKGEYLQPLEAYVQEIRMSALMNDHLWTIPKMKRDLHYGTDFDTDVTHLQNFFEQRNEWLYDVIMNYASVDADHIHMTMSALWGHVDEELSFTVAPWSKTVIQSSSHKQITEASDEQYALWQVDLVLAPMEGYVFDDPVILINDGYFKGEVQEEGSLHIAFLFEDHSYRPVDYYGEDIGLIYNPEYYAFNHPEVAALCEGDAQALMDYFCDEGMYEGQVGNGFLDPQKLLLYNPHLANVLGEEWEMYYWEFLAYGYEEGWILKTGDRFVPPVHAME